MNWMTVKEVADYLKMSEMTIYKLAQNRAIPASKIGSAWRFSQDTVDDWLLNKDEKETWPPEPAKSVIKDLIQDLKSEFGNNLSSVIIFGSYARGEATRDSDLDLLVVLKEIPDYRRAKEKIREIAYANTFEKGRLIVAAPILMSEREFLTGVSPILMNIRKEGRMAA